MPLEALPPTPGLHDLSLDQPKFTPFPVAVPLALSVDDTAKALGIGATLVWRLIKDKKLKAVKIYGRTVVPVAEIESFLIRNAQ